MNSLFKVIAIALAFAMIVAGWSFASGCYHAWLPDSYGLACMWGGVAGACALFVILLYLAMIRAMFTGDRK